MKIYLATSTRENLMLLLMCNIKNILVSFEYPEPFACKKLLEQNGVKIFIDSGAFSAWNKGRVINLDNYIEFIKQNASVIDQERIVNLDIIMGGKKVATKEQHEEACKKGFENYYYMKEKLTGVFNSNVDPIHVFHQGDDIKWLMKMLEECTYIGISPNNDFSDDVKEVWLRDCFRIIGKANPAIKTHAFGVTSDYLLKQFPYTTADSGSWTLSSIFGSVLTPFGRFIVSDGAIDKTKEMVHETQPGLHEMFKKLEPFKQGHIDLNTNPLIYEQLKEYLATFGFNIASVGKHYKYRSIVNIFFFIWLEEKINKNPPKFTDHIFNTKQANLV